ncbi:M23 family peptidase [Streptomyces armeniacus]|uniref:M23 family peptidase n=1 Tax=Streptomyces armeniacus TaxID=83291 RepID=A0A345XZA7_9ACTN|nr:M23 family peptidase [Streptomyces armeniacus]
MMAAVGAVAAVVIAAPVAVAAPGDGSSAGPRTGEPSAAAELARPNFKMPFLCGQTWVGSNWDGHSPGHSIDWNHYAADGSTDDFGRRVFSSAGGKVIASYYSTDTGYGNTVVIGHGNGWQTRYAHLKSRGVSRGDTVKQGQRIGRVGASSAKYELSPHLHYEQIHDGSVVVSVIQGVRWSDFMKRSQTSRNCG